MTQLDEHGARILAFVECYQRQNRRSPTYREIGAAVGLVSNDHVARDIRRLADQGYLSYTPGVSRSLVLLKSARARNRATTLPLPFPSTSSSISRGSRDELAGLAAGLFEDEHDTFILRAHGSGLADALLEEGDLVVVKRGESYTEGQMLALWFKRERRTALRYLYHENGDLRLEPVDLNAQVEHVNRSDIQVQGTVLAIIRKRDD
jgi:repressor LexA